MLLCKGKSKDVSIIDLEVQQKINDALQNNKEDSEMIKFLEELGCAMKFKDKEMELDKGDINGLLYNKLY